MYAVPYPSIGSRGALLAGKLCKSATTFILLAMIQSPDEYLAVLAEFDRRTATFEILDVHGALRKIDRQKFPEDRRRGAWAELAAFEFDIHPTADGGPWRTYFQPWGTFQPKDGALVCNPDLASADEEVIEYWGCRAKTVNHPVLAARYADLVWDTTKFVTKKKPDIQFAQLAIDSYVAAAKRDGGEVWHETVQSLRRALDLALRTRDNNRVTTIVEATIAYVDQTAEDDRVGIYCDLFDMVLLSKNGPDLSNDQEKNIFDMLEAKFAEITTPGTQWDVVPQDASAIGRRLASWYQRKGRIQDRQKILKAIGSAFERRAKIGDPLSGLHFLDEARKFYLEAGARDEAERIQRESQELAPEAKREMVPLTVEFEIPNDERNKFLDLLMERGLEDGLQFLTVCQIPRQEQLKEELKSLAEQYPLQAMFRPTLVGSKGIEANVDAPGDPDGRMAFETTRRVQLTSIWLSWGLDHLFKNGLTTDNVVDFVSKSPLFTADRLPLVRRGVESHILGDYVQSIHVLIPQIERALVGLTFLLGGTSTKPHGSGRAVMQAKSLNDALGDERVQEALGPDLRMYLVATLSHPKGMNIRNDVCHGLWTATDFNKLASERVLHVLLCLSLFRRQNGSEQKSL